MLSEMTRATTPCISQAVLGSAGWLWTTTELLLAHAFLPV